MYKSPLKPKESIRPLEAGVIGGCEPPKWVSGAKLRSFAREVYPLNS